MDDNKLRFGVGVLVIAALGIGIILTFLFGAFPTVLAREYKLLVHFDSASGVSTNTEVLRDGVKIGRVVDITLKKAGGVTLQLAMSDDQKLTHRYYPRIGVGSVITGDAVLEFVRIKPEQLSSFFSSEKNPEFFKEEFSDGDSILYGKNSEDPFNVLFGLEEEVKNTMMSIRMAGNSIESAGQNVNQLVTEVREVVGGTDSRIDDVAEEAAKALEEFQGAMRDVRGLLNNPQLKQGLEDALAALPDVLKEAKTTLETTQKTFESFQKVGKRFERVGEVAEGAVQEVGSVVGNVNKTVDTVRTTVQGAGKTLRTIEGTFKSAERTIRNVEKFSEPLAKNGDQIVMQVLTSLQNIDRALAQAEAFGASLNNNNGTLKRLLEDDEMYWQVRRTIENIEQASSRIKPILDDVRIFSDKVARDPRQLGIRGAVTRRPNGLGLK